MQLITPSTRAPVNMLPMSVWGIALDYTMLFQLTDKIRRQPYGLILHEKKQNSQEGKIIVITSGGTGIGAVRNVLPTF
jgi:hypothetical protein